MADELYFIPMIEQALRSPDPKSALVRAFKEIKAAGRASDSGQGLAQFERFMGLVAGHAETERPAISEEVFDVVRELMIELSTDTFEGSEQERQAALELIRSRPQWSDEYDDLLATTRACEDRKEGIPLVLERDDETIATWSVREDEFSAALGSIRPGHYALKLRTNRVIWHGYLTERELRWARAYPDQPLDLAAATDSRKQTPTLEAGILGGRLVIRVFAGVETGWMEISAGNVGREA
ncbi:MAG: hypothetical protein AMXMBFR13_06220 [Phycisphaerae bacterium]